MEEDHVNLDAILKYILTFQANVFLIIMTFVLYKFRAKDVGKHYFIKISPEGTFGDKLTIEKDKILVKTIKDSRPVLDTLYSRLRRVGDVTKYLEKNPEPKINA